MPVKPSSKYSKPSSKSSRTRESKSKSKCKSASNSCEYEYGNDHEASVSCEECNQCPHCPPQPQPCHPQPCHPQPCKDPCVEPCKENKIFNRIETSLCRTAFVPAFLNNDGNYPNKEGIITYTGYINNHTNCNLALNEIYISGPDNKPDSPTIVRYLSGVVYIDNNGIATSAAEKEGKDGTVINGFIMKACSSAVITINIQSELFSYPFCCNEKVQPHYEFPIIHIALSGTLGESHGLCGPAPAPFNRIVSSGKCLE